MLLNRWICMDSDILVVASGRNDDLLHESY